MYGNSLKKDRSGLRALWKQPSKRASKRTNGAPELLQGIAGQDRSVLKKTLQMPLQEVLAAHVEELIGLAPLGRTSNRRGHRADYCTRTLTTRVGTTELGTPQEREGKFSTEIFERYRRGEQALAF